MGDQVPALIKGLHDGGLQGPLLRGRQVLFQLLRAGHAQDDRVPVGTLEGEMVARCQRTSQCSGSWPAPAMAGAPVSVPTLQCDRTSPRLQTALRPCPPSQQQTGPSSEPPSSWVSLGGLLDHSRLQTSCALQGVCESRNKEFVQWSAPVLAPNVLSTRELLCTGEPRHAEAERRELGQRGRASPPATELVSTAGRQGESNANGSRCRSRRFMPDHMWQWDPGHMKQPPSQSLHVKLGFCLTRPIVFMAGHLRDLKATQRALAGVAE